MVFFTCNNCGESVKKPSVEKHYNTKCRGAPKSISCMDCQKDFQDNYVEHIKCISELEKYSGKDYVPRESANSGAKKQEGWVETVRAVLDSSEYELSKPTRQAFVMLQKYDNVPRKKAKFLNFVTNSVRIPRITVEEVWKVLEKEQEKLKLAKQKQLETATTEKQSTGKTTNESEPKKKKKKVEQNGQLDEDEKHGKKNTENTDEVECREQESIKQKDDIEESYNGVNAKKEKKLRKKKKLQNNDDKNAADATILTDGIEKKIEHPQTIETSPNIDENIPDKKKKKTGKSLELQNGVEAVLETDMDKIEKKKNKKSKSLEKKDIEVQLQENGNAVEIKNKNKRAINNEEVIDLDTPSKKQKLNGETQTSNKSSTKEEKIFTVPTNADEAEAYTFCWDYELTNIMSKYADGVDVKKLKKKILKKYKTKFIAELTASQQLGFEKKFYKKLKKNCLLKIEGDIVKSVS